MGGVTQSRIEGIQDTPDLWASSDRVGCRWWSASPNAFQAFRRQFPAPMFGVTPTEYRSAVRWREQTGPLTQIVRPPAKAHLAVLPVLRAAFEFEGSASGAGDFTASMKGSSIMPRQVASGRDLTEEGDQAPGTIRMAAAGSSGRPVSGPCETGSHVSCSPQRDSATAAIDRPVAWFDLVGEGLGSNWGDFAM